MTRERPSKALRVLLVEDHAPTMRLLREFFERRGHEVSLAVTCEEASAALAKGGYDLLLSDIGLPDGYGWDVMEERVGDSRPYAVAASGYGSRSDKARSRACGFREHLVKPFKSAELDRVILAALAWVEERGQGRGT